MKILRNRSGQGMTEYIIIVALIAIAAIAAFSYFGGTVRKQTDAMTASLAGDSTDAKTAISKAHDEGTHAGTDSGTDKDLSNYVGSSDSNGGSGK